MKKTALSANILVGIVLIVLGITLVKHDYYTTLLCAMGFGLIFSSAIHLSRALYYERPSNKEKAEQKALEARIDAHDERKVYLRMRAGYLTNQIMFFILVFLSFVLAVLRMDAWIIAMLFALYIFQLVAGMVIYRRLQKRL